MTTPKKPLQPTNKADDKSHDTKEKAWYRAPIIWIGVLLSALILFGYARLLIISHSNAVERAPLPKNDSQQITHIFGVPLHPEKTDNAKHNAADDGTKQ